MRLSIVGTILAKELIETLRDRRTLLMMIGLPVFMYPLLLLGVSQLSVAQSAARQARPSRVAVWGEAPAELLEWLRAGGAFVVEAGSGMPPELRRELAAGRFEPPPTPRPTPRPSLQPHRRPADSAPGVEGVAISAARTALASRKADAVLVAWPGLPEALRGGGLGQLTMFYDSVLEDSSEAKDRLDADLAAFRRHELLRRESELGLREGAMSALAVHPKNVAPPRRRMGQLLGAVLPFLLIVMSLIGGFYPAIDMTAGEKERGTMQTLLCAPLRPVEIIAGKFLAVWIIGLIASLANIVSLAVTLGAIVPSRELVIPASVYALIFAVLLPVTFLITAIFLAVASFAKDFKDGQNFLAPLYMVLALPSAACMVPGVELGPGTAFLPVVNIALLVKALLGGEAAAGLVALALGVAMLYGFLAILLAARVFEQEQVLLGGRVSVRSLLGLESARAPRGRSGRSPSPPDEPAGGDHSM